MSVLISLATAVAGSDGPNLWGMLGCAVAYAGAVLAAVDGLGDSLLQKDAHQGPRAVHGLRLKTGSKIGAAAITVITAGTVLVLDSNWLAFVLLTLAFFAIVLWVFYVYRESGRSRS